MDQHAFHELLQSFKLIDISEQLHEAGSAVRRAEFQRAREKNAKDRLFAACEELKLVQKHLDAFPFWGALRLAALHHDLQGHFRSSALAQVEPHIVNAQGAFPRDTFPLAKMDYGPLEQRDVEALDYKTLLIKLASEVPQVLDETLCRHPEVRAEELLELLQLLSKMHLHTFRADEEGAKEERDTKGVKTYGMARLTMNAVSMGSFFYILVLVFMRERPGNNSRYCLILGWLAGSFLAWMRKLQWEAERVASKQRYDAEIATAIEELRKAIAFIKAGTLAPTPSKSQQQLPAPSAPASAASPPPLKSRRTEPTTICSSCQQKIAFPKEMVGQAVACPSCGAQTSLDDMQI